VKDYNGKVRVVYKNMVVHPQVVKKGHLAGCAAGKQGKFNEFRHAWWEKAYAPYAASHDAAKLGDESINAIASELHLDAAKFKSDMDSPDCEAHVNADQQELSKWHVNATPSFFIDGRPFQWSGTPEGFKTAIDEEIKKVEASGVPCGEYYQKMVVEKGEQKFRSKKEPKPS
jgi:protein-disulfide isomerase